MIGEELYCILTECNTILGVDTDLKSKRDTYKVLYDYDDIQVAVEDGCVNKFKGAWRGVRQRRSGLYMPDGIWHDMDIFLGCEDRWE